MIDDCKLGHSNRITSEAFACVYINHRVIRKHVSVNRAVRNYLLDRMSNNSLPLVERLVALDSVSLGISNWTNSRRSESELDSFRIGLDTASKEV